MVQGARTGTQPCSRTAPTTALPSRGSKGCRAPRPSHCRQSRGKDAHARCFQVGCSAQTRIRHKTTQEAKGVSLKTPYPPPPTKCTQESRAGTGKVGPQGWSAPALTGHPRTPPGSPLPVSTPGPGLGQRALCAPHMARMRSDHPGRCAAVGWHTPRGHLSLWAWLPAPAAAGLWTAGGTEGQMDTGHSAQQAGPMSPSEDKGAGLGEQGPIQRAQGCPPAQRHTLVSLGVGGSPHRLPGGARRPPLSHLPV